MNESFSDILISNKNKDPLIESWISFQKDMWINNVKIIDPRNLYKRNGR